MADASVPPGPFDRKPGGNRPWGVPLRSVFGGPKNREGSGKRAAAVAAIVVAVLLIAAVLAFRYARGTSSGTESATPSTTSPGRAQGGFASAPGFRIYPQRAAAGAPLQLDVAGEGCPGSSGVLSITEIGTAADAGGQDRLVVRRRFDVDAGGRFSVTPLLVGQPPGSYRVVAACERARTAEPIDAVGRRDLYTMTEVLELSGNAGSPEFELAPTVATPGQATRLAMSGRSCTGSAATAEVRVFPPNTGDRPVPTVLSFPALGGSWRGETTIAAEAASGSYTVEARCTSQDGTAFDYITRTVRFGSPPGDAPAPSLLDIFSPRPKATAPAAVAKAVPGVPSYTG